MNLGVIARDDLWNVVQMWSVTRDGSLNVVVGDLNTVRVALLVAQQNGWRDIEVQVAIKTLAGCLQARRYPILNAITMADDIYLLAFDV